MTTYINKLIPAEEVWPRVRMEFKKAMLNSISDEGYQDVYKDNLFRPSAILHLYSNFPRRSLSPIIDASILISCSRADYEVGTFPLHHQRSNCISDSHSETASHIWAFQFNNLRPTVQILGVSI
jgi:hypothetical protein